MCRVRRETIWKWTRDGKLPIVLEPNAQGFPGRWGCWGVDLAPASAKSDIHNRA
jgi:hypothetical protein